MAVVNGSGPRELAEFLDVVSGCPDELSTLQCGLASAVHILGADVGAITRADLVLTSVGFPGATGPAEQILDVVAGRGQILDVPGVGACPALAVPFDGPISGHVVVARGGESFSPTEAELLSVMARVLARSIQLARTLEGERALREMSERQAEETAGLLSSLQERHGLFQRLAKIQRSMSHRAPLEEVLGSISNGAAALLGDDVASVRMIDPDDPLTTLLVASVGVPEELAAQQLRAPIGRGVGGRAVTDGRMVMVEDYQRHGPGAVAAWVNEGLQAAIAAPLHESGRPVGALIVASRRPGRRYTEAEQDVLVAFAEHAGIAISDAKTFDTMYEAFHDSLTGLPNRALFLDRLGQRLGRSTDEGSRIAVLFIDLDGFKVVNDSLGHTIGNQLLTKVAGRIRECVRPTDFAARLGGDEFAVLVEDVIGSRLAARLASRILEELRAPFVLGEQEVFISASVGIAVSVRGQEAPDELLRNADVAMYRAKTEGRGRFAVFELGMHAAVLERLELEAHLQRAIDHGEFMVRYEPIVHLGSGRITGVEALVRWAHPTRGLIAPDRFVPLAEETGLIVPIGRWVLEQASRQVHAWHLRYPSKPPLTLSVNLSPCQLQEPRLVSIVSQLLEETALDPHALVLEITESVLMNDTDATIDILWGLKKLGVRLAIDDFGTGYSSLSYLRRLPIDILKIDRSFVSAVTNGPEDAALARAIVRIGQTLHLDTVAEGIESGAHLRELRAIGCDFGQGYHFSRPVEPEAFGAMLSDPSRRRPPLSPVDVDASIAAL